MMKRQLKVKLVGKNARLPVQQHPGDAGFDLFVSEAAVIEPGEFVDVSTGVHVQLGPDTWGLIMGRSSTVRKRGLQVQTAVIDSGWRGELFCGVVNLGAEQVEIEVGERVAQLIPMAIIAADMLQPMQVDELEEHVRGENGFGSTGE